jgi:hypothetical protein
VTDPHIQAAKLGFLTGVQAGIELAVRAMKASAANIDTNLMSAQMLQLADDWALLIEERMATPEWSDALDDLEVIRMRDALDRGLKTMFRE